MTSGDSVNESTQNEDSRECRCASLKLTGAMKAVENCLVGTRKTPFLFEKATQHAILQITSLV